jgi:MFS family permease
MDIYKHDERTPTKEFSDLPNSEISSVSPSGKSLKAAHRKADIRLLCWYAFVFLIMRMNVNNISNTAIMNLEQGTSIKKELGNLSSSQWAWALSIFWYPYMFLEPLATLMLKRFSPSVWMSRIMLTWGIISMCQGATHNYTGILLCRFFLGVAEAGFFPGVLFHLAFWYSPDRLPLRIAFLYSCGMFTGTISGLLAYAVSFMNGAAGLAGWRWVCLYRPSWIQNRVDRIQLFILEGIPPILCAFYTFFYLPNYPQTVAFLSEDEQAAIVADLPKQAPTMEAKTFDLKQVKSLLTSPTFIPFLMIWITHGIGGWGISFVLPTVIYDLGISDTAISQIMTMVCLLLTRYATAVDEH